MLFILIILLFILLYIIASVREKYKWTTLIRDGAFGQINAGSKLHGWNESKGRNMFMTKWSAGCSMSEATNDLGHMHNILHDLFSSCDFKCKEIADPPGVRYSTLKKFIQTHLTAASFKTYWKCICAMELFMLKAFTPMNVQSALHKAGFEGDKINTHTIMSHNVEFVRIQPPSRSDELLRLIDTVFVSYWWNHGIIHEQIFNEIFDGEKDIDTLNQREGKPLNELSTNRQRFMMDNHECWITEMNRRKDADAIIAQEKATRMAERAAADTLRPLKCRDCCQPGCPNTIDISTSALKRTNDKLWNKCNGKGCRFWCCTEHANVINLHKMTCRKFLLSDDDNDDGDKNDAD